MRDGISTGYNEKGFCICGIGLGRTGITTIRQRGGKMKLEKLSEALAIATEHGLDGVDLAILGAIHDKRRSDGAATIMQFSNGLPFASFGTIHARVKRMVKKGFIRKHIEETNQRCKILEDGPKLEQFLDKLSDV